MFKIFNLPLTYEMNKRRSAKVDVCSPHREVNIDVE